MMQEILSLLRASATDEHAEPLSDTVALDRVEPLPFPSESDRIREPAQDALGELRKKIRAKLGSRRHSRRRKETAKVQATQLRELNDECTRLHALEARLGETLAGQDAECLHVEAAMLVGETHATAEQTMRLYEQVERMVLPDRHTSVVERALRMQHLAGVLPVRRDASNADQLDRAVANVRALDAALSNTQRVSTSEFSVSVFRGWRVVQCKCRGSHTCVQATKTVAGVSRASLRDSVWQNADDPIKRVVTSAFYVQFSLVTAKPAALDAVFYSDELHEFPSPFLCRSFSSIHGGYSNQREWYYVKHSIHGALPKVNGQSAAEIVGVILRENTPGDGVHVALILLYDTQSVCHAEQIVCEEPPVCHRVLSHWEQHHGIAVEE